jgi:hypothetical protein
LNRLTGLIVKDKIISISSSIIGANRCHSLLALSPVRGSCVTPFPLVEGGCC